MNFGKYAMPLGIASLALAMTCGSASAAPVVVTAGGLSASDNTNWVTNGLNTQGGAPSGVDWTVSGQQEGPTLHWTYQGDGGQGSLGSPTLEWPTAGNLTAFGYTIGFQNMGLGSDMAVDVAAEGGTLVISQVAPAAGDYTLNGVTQTATAVGDVLQWLAAGGVNLTAGNTLEYDSTATVGADSVANGPIGFSAIPEPASLSLLALGGLGLLARRRHA